MTKKGAQTVILKGEKNKKPQTSIPNKQKISFNQLAGKR